mmetsp:Transcript_42910/g.71542  ORF Transcript_42910/g.71542 Transcript_42910/m.71542 type:complete len:317 (+) Transcript_42910:415-1365(+)
MVHHLRHIDPLNLLADEHVLDLLLVLGLVEEVQLCVETDRPFVEERHVVGALLGGKALHQTLVDFRGAAQDVEVLADSGQHIGPLHLYRHPLPALHQLSSVDLRQARRSDWFWRKLAEHLRYGPAQLRLDHLQSDLRRESLHAILENGELFERRRGKHVGPHAQHLAHFDICGTEFLHDYTRVLCQRRAVLFQLIHTTCDQHAYDACEVGDGIAEELRPSLLQSAPLFFPILLNQVFVVHHGETFLVHLAEAGLVQSDKGFVCDIGRFHALAADRFRHLKRGEGRCACHPSNTPWRPTCARCDDGLASVGLRATTE